jgi:hypothetical protein
MLLGDRRIGQEVARLDANASCQLLLAGVDFRQGRSRGEKLEGAAYGKAFVGAMSGRRAALRIENCDAEPPAALRFDLCESFDELRKAGFRFGGEATSADRSAAKERRRMVVAKQRRFNMRSWLPDGLDFPRWALK